MITLHGVGAQVIDKPDYLCVRTERRCPRCDAADLFDYPAGTGKHGARRMYAAGCRCGMCVNWIRSEIAKDNRRRRKRTRDNQRLIARLSLEPGSLTRPRRKANDNAQ